MVTRMTGVEQLEVLLDQIIGKGVGALSHPIKTIEKRFMSASAQEASQAHCTLSFLLIQRHRFGSTSNLRLTNSPQPVRNSSLSR